ncbi:MAG: hypothetical protein KIT82_13350 [Bradyrhizobium sp.]|nr:hypothetical protein [Bradyrhizobium sp.]
MTDIEQSFMDEIDARFPYEDRERCAALIDRGIAISPNAAFAVLHEICRPGRGVSVSADRLMEHLAYWRSAFKHPAADMLAEVAEAMIHRRDLPVEDVIGRMRILAQYPGLYAALAILYFSCDDVDERIEPVDAEIRNNWGRALDRGHQ